MQQALSEHEEDIEIEEEYFDDEENYDEDNFSSQA